MPFGLSIFSYAHAIIHNVNVDSQETSINHMKKTGFIHEGLGSEEMSKYNLTWVVAKIQMVVDRYPKWYNIHFHLYMVLGSL